MAWVPPHAPAFGRPAVLAGRRAVCQLILGPVVFPPVYRAYEMACEVAYVARCMFWPNWSDFGEDPFEDEWHLDSDDEDEHMDLDHWDMWEFDENPNAAIGPDAQVEVEVVVEDPAATVAAQTDKTTAHDEQQHHLRPRDLSIVIPSATDEVTPCRSVRFVDGV